MKVLRFLVGLVFLVVPHAAFAVVDLAQFEADVDACLLTATQVEDCYYIFEAAEEVIEASNLNNGQKNKALQDLNAAYISATSSGAQGGGGNNGCGIGNGGPNSGNGGNGCGPVDPPNPSPA